MRDERIRPLRAVGLACVMTAACGASRPPASTTHASTEPADARPSTAPTAADAGVATNSDGDVRVEHASVVAHLTVQGVEVWMIGASNDSLAFVRVQYRAPQYDPEAGRIVAPLPSSQCDRNDVHSVAPDTYEFERSIAEADHQYFDAPLEYLELALARSRDNAPVCLSPVRVQLNAAQVATVHGFLQAYRESLGARAPARMLADAEPIPADLGATGFVDRYSDGNGTGHHFVRANYVGGGATWRFVRRIPVRGALEPDVRLAVESDEPSGRRCDEALVVAVDGRREQIARGSMESEGNRVTRSYAVPFASVEAWPRAARVSLTSCGHALDVNAPQRETFERFIAKGNEIVAALASHRL